MTNGDLTTTPQETLDTISAELIPQDGVPLLINKREPDHALINQTLAPHRLDRAIKALKLNKAPGPDKIRNQMVSKAWDTIKSPVRNIFHNALALGSTPASWWETTGCIIAKPNKPDYTNPRAFRIISLTSAFQKILERLVLWQLESSSGLSVNLTRNQHGFKKGSSTESAIHNLVRKIKNSTGRGAYAMGIFLDIEGAFDNISFSALDSALTEFKIPPTFIDWICHLTSNRYITLSYCGLSVRIKVTKGCPQGGVLSPLLWNITLNTLLSSLGYNSSFIQAFADDLVILIQGICKATISSIAQTYLNKINTWCTSKGLKLSELKTKIILFTKKQDTSLPAQIVLNGKVIDPVTETTYLGVIFDSKLTWIPHINNKLKKGITCLQACSRAIGKTWGLTPSSIRWLYNQVILPSVSYACFVWYSSLGTRQHLLDYANRLQRNAALLITRGLHSSPLANLEILAGLTPIYLHLQQAALKTARRLKAQNHWVSNYAINTRGHFDSHAFYLDKLLGHLPISTSSYTEIIPSTLILDRSFRISINSRPDTVNLIDKLPTTAVNIYTDGSKRNSLTGAGFCVMINNIEIHCEYYTLGTFPSVFQCELYALLQGAQWAQLNISTPSFINFFSDSQAAIYSINSTNCDNSLALNTINTLNSIGSTNKVTVHWVPGHSNITGNDRADELARTGSDSRPTGPEPFLPFSKNHSNSEIRNLMISQHQAQYEDNELSEKGKIPILIYFSKYKYKFSALPATHQKWLTWVLSGHSPLFYFQHRIGKAYSQYCEFCQQEPETSEHFLCQCVRYATTRLQTFGQITMTWTELLNHKLSTVCKYISKTDRFNSSRIFTDRT
jgi:ribonuclease HI/retron-type reverse transcriptase